MLCSGLLSFCRIVIRTVLDLATPLAIVAVTVLADQDRLAHFPRVPPCRLAGFAGFFVGPQFLLESLIRFCALPNGWSTSG